MNTANESAMRYSQQIESMIGGKSLLRDMKEDYPCRFLKKGLHIALGPVSDDALAFRPLFKCPKLTSVDILMLTRQPTRRLPSRSGLSFFVAQLLEDYSDDGFLMAFIRFSCCYGYPKKSFPDEGSQLSKGCKNVVSCIPKLVH